MYKLIDDKMGAKMLGGGLMEYEPNAQKKMEIHYHQKRESAYIVLGGSATLMLNGVKHELTPNTFVLISPGDRHGIVAIGEQGLRMIEIWSPLAPSQSEHEKDYVYETRNGRNEMKYISSSRS